MEIKLYGTLDPHTHLRDLDWKHKGSFASETRAALFGGYWALMDMPNTSPSTISEETLLLKQKAIDAAAYCDWGLYFGASKNNNAHLHSKVSADCCGLKIYTNSTTGDLLIDDPALIEVHFKHWPAQRVISVHAEEEQVVMILNLVRKYRKPTHFVHVCSALELKYLQAAKEEGLPISLGVCPHHLYLNAKDMVRLGAFGCMKPSLKTEQDSAALWKALGNGLIDMIESDHAPHTLEEKKSIDPPFGVPGLQTNLPLLFLAVKEKRIAMQRAIDLVSTNPRKRFGIALPADTYTLLDLDETYLLRNADMEYHCGWTPFDGMPAAGRIKEVWIRGTKVFDGKKILVSQGFRKQLLHSENRSVTHA